MKLKLFILTLLSFFLLPSLVGAAEATFVVRLGNPKTPTNKNEFKLTFVVLDTRNDRNLKVSCYKKGPSDIAPVIFDTEKTLIPGGNTDSCQVNSSVMDTKGSYTFHVVAKADGGETATSSQVTVEYTTDGPNAPVSFSKEKLNQCDYKIRFKTADDGRTAKIQLFRSDNLSIPVGPSSVVASINIAPNTEGEIVNSVPVCGKDYYFAIRAVDNSDNASGVIGDSFTTTVTTTTTDNGTGTNGAIVIDGAQSQVSDGGKSNDATDSADGDINITISATPVPEILGSSTDSKKNFYRFLLLLIAVFTAYVLTRVTGKKKGLK